MATRLALAAIAALIAATVVGPGAARAAHPIPGATVVQSGLVVPWDVAFAPDGRMFVTERPGRIRVYASAAPGAAQLSVTTIEDVRAEHEAGVMGVAVDVDFATNRWIYVCASRDEDGSTGPAPWVNEVLRYTVNPDGTLADGPLVLPGVVGAVANTQHNGCAVEMDAGGYLFVTIGDGGSGPRAQDPTSLNGKVLRLHRDGSVPANNPDLGAGPTAVYSLGHRNPQGLGFAPGSGAIYAVEHGPNVNDEMNLIVAGGNYGWPCYTGASTPNSITPDCGPASDYRAPVWSSGSTTIASSGMTFLNHPAWESWNGSAVVAQLKEQDLRRFTPTESGAMHQVSLLFDGAFGRLRAATMAPDGALYITTSNGTGDRVIRIAPGPVVVDRYAGSDRYATAVAVSAGTFPVGTPVVHVATGATYPDALAGGAAAARDRGPVLLVTQNTIPSATAAELTRLKPNRIVVLGGTGAISSAVESQLGSFAPGGVTRAAGPDRFATAAAIARSFAPGVPVTYIATGMDYPDALAGVPAAGLEGGPILLVTSTTIPASTAAELERLKPGRIVILGGTGVVSAQVATNLQQYTASGIVRRSGSDRYATAVAISRATFAPGVRQAFVATGVNYPDGLTGGPAGAYVRGPLLLVPGTSLPASVRDELLRLDPERVTILGGTSVVTESVRAEIEALLNP
ncbi:MAG TPA: PQQ-dependent sugar dehydrogenase [Candidatus Binatia bacterium]|nr:PQQ-dependent sugar dehydrogenase [Candidatus Binatia bacterium]